MASYPRANPYHAYPVDADRNLVGTYDRNEALRDLKNRSASPYASSSFRPPMNRETPVSNVAPVANQEQTAPMAMPQLGLLGGSPIGGGLLAASNVLSQAGMNSPMPRSLGSAIGPALNAFAQGYAQDQQTAIKRAREQALINKYGPEAMVPGAIGAIIKNKGETANRNQLTQTIKNMFPTTNSPSSVSEQRNIDDGIVPQKNTVKTGNQGFVVTPDRVNQLNLSAISGKPEKVAEIIKGFKTIDNSLVKDARDRLKKPFEDYRKIRVAFTKANTALSRESGPGDLTAVTTIQRMIDDGIVRKEDMDNWARTVGAADSFVALIQRTKDGQALLPKVRGMLRLTASDLLDAQESSFQSFLEMQKDLATANNVPWNRVFSKTYEKFLKRKPLDSGSTNSIKKGTFG